MRKALTILGLVLSLAAITLVPACSTLEKSEVEAALLALDKNRSAAALGIEAIAVSMRVDDEFLELEGRYLRLPAQDAAATASPIVLIHGTPSSLFNWTELLFDDEGGASLNEAHDVYALDVIGHGVTRSALPEYSFQRCADYVGAFLDALDLEDVCLVGNSYGGEFVWRAALDRPDRISHVVLIDSSGYARTEEEFLPEEQKMREMSLADYGWLLNSRERIRVALEPHLPNGVSDDQLEEMFLVCENVDNWHAMIDLARDENGTRAAELATLLQPTLLLWGEGDIAYSVERFAQRFAADIPDASLHILEGTAHYPHEERPAEVRRLILEFLAEGSER